MLDQVRHLTLVRISREARSLARQQGLHSVANTIHMSASQVRVDHPAAGYLEFGIPAGTMPPPGSLHEWLVSVGKTIDEEYPVARAIKKRGLKARPFLRPAIEKAMAQIDDDVRRIWGH